MKEEIGDSNLLDFYLQCDNNTAESRITLCKKFQNTVGNFFNRFRQSSKQDSKIEKCLCLEKEEFSPIKFFVHW